MSRKGWREACLSSGCPRYSASEAKLLGRAASDEGCPLQCFLTFCCHRRGNTAAGASGRIVEARRPRLLLSKLPYSTASFKRLVDSSSHLQGIACKGFMSCSFDIGGSFHSHERRVPKLKRRQWLLPGSKRQRQVSQKSAGPPLRSDPAPAAQRQARKDRCGPSCGAVPAPLRQLPSDTLCDCGHRQGWLWRATRRNLSGCARSAFERA